MSHDFRRKHCSLRVERSTGINCAGSILMRSCDVPLQKEQAFEIKADVPGVDKKDIKLSVDGDVLSLSVQKTQAKEVSHISSDCALPCL